MVLVGTGVVGFGIAAAGSLVVVDRHCVEASVAGTAEVVDSTVEDNHLEVVARGTADTASVAGTAGVAGSLAVGNLEALGSNLAVHNASAASLVAAPRHG